MMTSMKGECSCSSEVLQLLRYVVVPGEWFHGVREIQPLSCQLGRAPVARFASFTSPHLRDTLQALTAGCIVQSDVVYAIFIQASPEKRSHEGGEHDYAPVDGRVIGHCTSPPLTTPAKPVLLTLRTDSCSGRGAPSLEIFLQAQGEAMTKERTPELLTAAVLRRD